jgi:hypothetical protein
MRTVSASRQTLSNVMEFDHVIRVHGDGTVSDGIDTPWAPEVTMTVADPRHPFVDSQHGLPVPWSLVNGYSGQYGYAGPIMHASEFIGGRMADDILSTPGLYVAVTVTCVDDDDIAGWAVAHIPADE